MRTALLGLLAAIGLCSGCATITGESTTSNCSISQAVTTSLGNPFPEKAHKLFGGELMIQAFEDGILFSQQNGNKEMVKLTHTTLERIQPIRGIANVYNAQGGASTFGLPVQGEHWLFGGKYTCHIFDKSVIVWFVAEGKPEAAIFSQQFSRTGVPDNQAIK